MKNSLCMSLLSLVFMAVVASSAARAAETKNTTDVCADENHYPLVTKSDLQTMVTKKTAFVIDVNSKESFDKTHVPTAVHYEAVKSNFAKTLPAKKDALIVSYCGGPACMAWLDAAKEACQMGYTNIKHFKEGISGWNKSGT